MIGSVETGAFEDNANRLVNLPQCFLITFRAFHQRRIRKFLLLFKLNAAALTPIGIDWHSIEPLEKNSINLQNKIIARLVGLDKRPLNNANKTHTLLGPARSMAEIDVERGVDADN